MRAAEWNVLQIHYSYMYRFWSDKLHMRTLHMYILTYRMKNKEVLYRFQKERNVINTRKRRSANWIDNTFRMNWIMEHVTAAVTEGKLEATGIRSRCEDLLANFEETREYWKFRDTALYCSMWRTMFWKSLWGLS